jgi:hypothetical protein
MANVNENNSITQNDLESETSSIGQSIDNLKIKDESRSKIYYSDDCRKIPSDSTSLVSDSSEGYFENLTDSESSQLEVKRKQKKVGEIISNIKNPENILNIILNFKIN